MAKKTKQVATKRKPGRPSVWVDDIVELARRACRLGATNKTLGEFFDVSEKTIEDWLRTKPDFFAAVKDGRMYADVHIAESLYRRAEGYAHEAVKIFMVDEVTTKTDEDGDEVTVTTKKPVYVPYTERYPPDTVACIFWLKNRQPDLWREKHEHDIKHEGSFEFTLKIGAPSARLGDDAKLINDGR